MIVLRLGLLLALGLTLTFAEEEVIKCPDGECVKLHLCRDGEIVTDGSNLIDIRFNPDDPCEHYLLKCCNVQDAEVVIDETTSSNGDAELIELPPSTNIQTGPSVQSGNQISSNVGSTGSTGTSGGDVSVHGPHPVDERGKENQGNYLGGSHHGGGSFTSSYSQSSSSSSSNSFNQSVHQQWTGPQGPFVAGSGVGSNVNGSQMGGSSVGGSSGQFMGSGSASSAGISSESAHESIGYGAGQSGSIGHGIGQTGSMGHGTSQTGSTAGGSSGSQHGSSKHSQTISTAGGPSGTMKGSTGGNTIYKGSSSGAGQETGSTGEMGSSSSGVNSESTGGSSGGSQHDTSSHNLAASSLVTGDLNSGNLQNGPAGTTGTSVIHTGGHSSHGNTAGTSSGNVHGNHAGTVGAGVSSQQTEQFNTENVGSTNGLTSGDQSGAYQAVGSGNAIHGTGNAMHGTGPEGNLVPGVGIVSKDQTTDTSSMSSGSSTGQTTSSNVQQGQATSNQQYFGGSQHNSSTGGQTSKNTFEQGSQSTGTVLDGNVVPSVGIVSKDQTKDISSMSSGSSTGQTTSNIAQQGQATSNQQYLGGSQYSSSTSGQTSKNTFEQGSQSYKGGSGHGHGQFQAGSESVKHFEGDGCTSHTQKHTSQSHGHSQGHKHNNNGSGYGSSLISGTTVNPILPPRENVGCGIRNPDGVGFRITGDTDGESEYGEFPWMVAILKEEKALDQVINVYQCGGSLIHPQVVLTAAHCVQNKQPHEIKVRLGEWDTQTTNEIHDHQDRNVADIVVHDKFYKGGLFNDFALLFLDKPAEIIETVNTICLPPQDFNFDLSRCFASGWGKNVFGKEGKYQVILKKIELPVMPFNQCQEALRTTRLGRRFILNKSFICAGGEPGKDACKGDGGSPLVCPIAGSPNRYYQAGIVAWGIGCGEKGIPGVYANVAGFRTWIDEHLTQRSIPHDYYIAV